MALEGSKRAVSSSGADKVSSAKPKKAKRGPNQAKSSTKGAATVAIALDTNRAVNISSRFARKGNVLLATDLDSSGDEEDIPLSMVGRTAPKALLAPSTEKMTHVHDFQDPEDDGHNSDGNGSDEDIDPEARDQALAEMSESDDEVLASMEACGETQAIGAGLAAEPMWSKPEPNLKGKGKGVAHRIALELDDDLEEISDHERKSQMKRKLKLNQDVETGKCPHVLVPFGQLLPGSFPGYWMTELRATGPQTIALIADLQNSTCSRGQRLNGKLPAL
ncbi:hypothetical protein V8D89_012135 [Ganoderma adspersum]